MRILEGAMIMATGKVKWFSESKGFGFIEAEDGTDVFVHKSEVQAEDLTSLSEGDPVTFEVVQGDKGPKATNVCRG